MAVWLVRAGKSGEREDFALEKGQAVIGWEEMPDLSTVKSRAALEQLYRTVYHDLNSRRVGSHVGQLWAFVKEIQQNDLVILPLKRRAAIAVGKVTGPYKFNEDFPEDVKHAHAVEWAATDIPRTAFDQDILYSLGALGTIRQIARNNAEERIRAVVENWVKKGTVGGKGPPEEIEIPEGFPQDLEEYAHDQIRTFIGQRFRGHELSRLVAALLESQGYVVGTSPAGPDGGLDIIAGRGSLGSESPRLCVQVKSSDTPVDVKVLRELQAVTKNFGGDQGLLVAWGGFKDSVWREARSHYFEVRLWTAEDLVTALLANYDRLPEALKAELPLKRVWMLVPTEE